MPTDDEILEYHSEPRPGKIETVPTKPCLSQSDLALAYTPGVALPCRKIQADPNASYDYTDKGNLVGVITNGTAVLGLGNIGALAAKPVMEGKAVLFKRFADLDVFDIEINTEDPDEFIQTVKGLEPTFGGINLEDIKAPDCFYIEETLRRETSIPVFHDDQHGTAIISAAALINACRLTGRRPEDLRVVVNGAGAAAIATANLYILLGVKRENITFVDSRGVIYKGRKQGMNPYKEVFARDTHRRSLTEAARGADVLLGLSVEGAFTPELLQELSKDPIIFALANPEPEIGYYEAKKARPDAIIATGRSDYPNQVNNVLGFPFIFRGALDVRASAINEEMKLAAVYALAELPRQDVPDSVIRAYGGITLTFGPEYIIPKPLDPRVLLKVTPAVAEAAVRTGVARTTIGERNAYIQSLEARLGPEREIMRKIITRAQQNPKRIVLPEGDHPVILRAAHHAASEGIAHPILLGNRETIEKLANQLHVPLDGIEIIDHMQSPLFDDYVQKLHMMRARKGWGPAETRHQLQSRFVFGAMMVHEAMVDGQVHGISRSYPDSIRPVLQVISRRPGVNKVSGVYLMIFRDRILLFADATVNINPTSEDLAEIALLTADMARFFDIDPRVAMLSFSNFGDTRHPDAKRVEKAVEIAARQEPALVIDGEMQADTAVVADILQTHYPFNNLGAPANVLIFPELASGNIAYKLMQQLGGAKAVGPLLMGISKPFNVLQRGTDMENVVNVMAITVAQAQEYERKPYGKEAELPLSGFEPV
ncbi:MAG: NADP-dependent malic enzyme [Desulfobacterales bacterium]|nr:NADP-dependent malic enzyme [Desulfobacterales bacterium]